MQSKRGLGWLPDVPKPSDYTESHTEVVPLLQRTRLAPRLATAPVATMPTQVDLRNWFSPIEDQGYIGSCTANAAIGLLEYFQRRTKGGYVNASRLFLYKVERNLLGWVGDTGAYLRTAVEALVLFSAPPERYWPYDGGPWDTNLHYDVEPPAFCYAFGTNYKTIKYFRLDGPGTSTTQLLTIKTYLAHGFPSMFGFPVYSEFDNPLPGGLIAFPTPNSNYRGGHAIVAAGYDDNLMIGADKGALLVRNSWGTTWGNAGYGWMSYKYVTEDLAEDWWTLISAEWVNTGQF